MRLTRRSFIFGTSAVGVGVGLGASLAESSSAADDRPDPPAGMTAAPWPLRSPRRIRPLASGGILVLDAGNSVVRRVRDGELVTIAGNGRYGGQPPKEYLAYVPFLSDGRGNASDGDPSNTALGAPVDAAELPDGSLLIADLAGHRVLALREGRIELFAGSMWPPSSTGDGGPATEAGLTFPTSVAVDSVGNAYIGETATGLVRRVSPDGVISTVLGTGAPSAFKRARNGRAAGTTVGEISALRVDRSGRLLVVDSSNFAVYGVDIASADPTIEIVAGVADGSWTSASGRIEDAPATRTSLGTLMDIAETADGKGLLLADFSNGRIDRLSAEGRLSTVLGGSLTDAGHVAFSPTSVLESTAQRYMVVDHHRWQVLAA